MAPMIHFYASDGYPCPNWDIAIQSVGEGYVPFSTEQNGHAGGLHVMDDHGNLVQALPQNKHDARDTHQVHLYAMWGSYGVDDTYFCH